MIIVLIIVIIQYCMNIKAIINIYIITLLYLRVFNLQYCTGIPVVFEYCSNYCMNTYNISIE